MLSHSNLYFVKHTTDIKTRKAWKAKCAMMLMRNIWYPALQSGTILPMPQRVMVCQGARSSSKTCLEESAVHSKKSGWMASELQI